jgi:hypothetical protein
MKYTVLLLRPDYVASEYGHDTLLLCVDAQDPREAVEAARNDAQRIESYGGDVVETEDYWCLLCCRGEVMDYSDGRGSAVGKLVTPEEEHNDTKPAD